MAENAVEKARRLLAEGKLVHSLRESADWDERQGGAGPAWGSLLNKEADKIEQLVVGLLKEYDELLKANASFGATFDELAPRMADQVGRAIELGRMEMASELAAANPGLDPAEVANRPLTLSLEEARRRDEPVAELETVEDNDEVD